MREAVGEDERLAHALEGEEPVGGIGLPACEKDLCGDTGAEGSEQMKNIALPRSVRKEEKAGEGLITGVEIGGSVFLEEMTMISWNGKLRTDRGPLEGEATSISSEDPGPIYARSKIQSRERHFRRRFHASISYDGLWGPVAVATRSPREARWGDLTKNGS